MTDIPTNAPVGTSTVVRAAPPVRAKSSGIYNSILITQRVPMSIVYIGDNIKQALEKKIAFEMGGKFPNSKSELIKLKGIGDYTSSAIASFCFDEPTAVIDGNVFRFIGRMLGIFSPIDLPETKARINIFLQKEAIADAQREWNS